MIKSSIKKKFHPDAKFSQAESKEINGNGKENLDLDVVNQTVNEIAENGLIPFSTQRLLSNVISSDSDLPTEDFWCLKKLRKSSGLPKISRTRNQYGNRHAHTLKQR